MATPLMHCPRCRARVALRNGMKGKDNPCYRLMERPLFLLFVLSFISFISQFLFYFFSFLCVCVRLVAPHPIFFFLFFFLSCRGIIVDGRTFGNFKAFSFFKLHRIQSYRDPCLPAPSSVTIVTLVGSIQAKGHF